MSRPELATHTVNLLVACAHDALDAHADRADILQSIAKSGHLGSDPVKTASLLAEAVVRLAERDRKAALISALLES